MVDRPDRYQTPHDWRDEAACNGIDPSVFFVSNRKKASIWARRLCMECDVRIQCLNLGMTQEFGIWGGTIAEDRAAIQMAHEEHETLSLFELLTALDRRVMLRYRHYGWDVEELYDRLQIVGALYRENEVDDDI